MKNFFIQFNCNQAKNKAQEELQKFAYEYQNTLLDQHGLNRLVQLFKEKTAEINLKYPRCKKMEITYNKLNHSDTYSFYAHTEPWSDTYIFTSSIDQMKRVFYPFEIDPELIG